eukprot:m.12578 g.12578  ORF g.12578 m.12578 type:complete len:347 (+) comp5836_c0_seq1:476-1516(+)
MAQTPELSVADPRLKLALLIELKRLGINVGRACKHDAQLIGAQPEQAPASGVFGNTIEALVANDPTQVDDLVVPRILAEIGKTLRDNMQTEGLFRVNGNQIRMKTIQAEVDGGQRISGTVHDQTGLLKLFFRKTPDPLFTHLLYEPFVRAFSIAHEEARLSATLMLCLLLPSSHLHSLAYLMQLLLDIARNPSNKMTPATLASIVTPNLIRPITEPSATTSKRELENHASCVGLVEVLIVHAEDIGKIPRTVIEAARANTDPDQADRDYRKKMAGRKRWWQKVFPRRNRVARHRTGSVSVDTLNVLRRSERLLKEQHTPVLTRRSQGAAAISTGEQYSQILHQSTS